MRDEIDGRLWADHHHSFSNEVDGRLRAIGRAFLVAMQKLSEIEYDAPWTRVAADKRDRCS